MKKALLASTAIVGGALIAAPAAMAGNTVSGDNYTVSLGGIHRILFGQYDIDNSTGVGRGYAIKQPFSEVWVKAAAQADNGIKYGVEIEVEARGDASEAADEIWAYFEGDNWGRVEIGNQDGTFTRMRINGANALVATGGYQNGLGLLQFAQQRPGTTDFGNLHNLRRADAMSVSLGGGGDATKAIYFTPRFAGFQLGVSLQPDANLLGRTNSLDNDGAINELWEFGANYVGKVGDVGVTVAGVYQYSDDTDGAVVAGTSNTQFNDVEVWNIGAKIDFAGFSLAGSYQDNNETLVTELASAAGADQGEVWNVGLGYKAGPWGVSAGYQYAERDVTSTVEADISTYVVGAQYAVAPGWTAMAEFAIWDLDNGPGQVDAGDKQVFMVTNQFVF